MEKKSGTVNAWMGMHGCMDGVGGGVDSWPLQVFQGFAQKKKKKKKILGLDDGCFEKLQKKPEPEEDAETLQVVEDGQDGTSFASARVGHVAN